MNQFGFESGQENGCNQPLTAPVSAAKKQKIKLQIPILIFALLALIGGFLQTFLQYKVSDDYSSFGFVISNFDWLTVGKMFLFVIPVIILILYVAFLYRYSACSFLLPLIFGMRLLAFLVICGVYISYRPITAYFLIALLYIVLEGCMFISAFGGFKIKLLFSIPLVLEAICILYILVKNYRFYLSFNRADFFVYAIFIIITPIFWALAWILFVYRDKFNSNACVPQSAQTPRQMLLSLKAAYESGSISREEYTARRAEIIKKL